MELKLYDTLTKEKRVFAPLDPSNVRMYVCGPTVYDFAHIGNARPVIVFDVLFRLLRHIYGDNHVKYVRNITDVDDKINARAILDFPGLTLNEAIRNVTEKTANQFHADVAALGCIEPTHEPRATDFVLPRTDGKADMRTLIQVLLDRDNAYVAIGVEGKEVLFDVTSMKDYGALSGRKLEDQKAGARVAVDAHKKNPGDFVLWKESGSNEPGWNGEFEFVPNPKSGWDAEFKISRRNASILGSNSQLIAIHGRPGWHIECSAMSAAYLGEVFDIHGGGLDLIFPHHENEIAQSRCAHDTPTMANYWMHNGFVQVEGEKMSKSLGNFVTINELLETTKFGGRKWPGQVVRLAMLSSNYRQPINWTVDALLEAEKLHANWSDFCKSAPTEGTVSSAVIAALSDDLNTAQVITELHALRKLGDATSLRASLHFLGIGLIIQLSVHMRVQARMEATATVVTTKEVDDRIKKIDNLIAARATARANKDFAESDRIRDELAAMGVAIKDGKDADGKPVTTWEIAR